MLLSVVVVVVEVPAGCPAGSKVLVVVVEEDDEVSLLLLLHPASRRAAASSGRSRFMPLVSNKRRHGDERHEPENFEFSVKRASENWPAAPRRPARPG